jgi:hypothetical protein
MWTGYLQDVRSQIILVACSGNPDSSSVSTQAAAASALPGILPVKAPFSTQPKYAVDIESREFDFGPYRSCTYPTLREAHIEIMTLLNRKQAKCIGLGLTFKYYILTTNKTKLCVW